MASAGFYHYGRRRRQAGGGFYPMTSVSWCIGLKFALPSLLLVCSFSAFCYLDLLCGIMEQSCQPGIIKPMWFVVRDDLPG